MGMDNPCAVCGRETADKFVIRCVDLPLPPHEVDCPCYLPIGSTCAKSLKAKVIQNPLKGKKWLNGEWK